MLTDKKCILYVYKGHLGLPSIDYKCLQALFIVKMNENHKIEVKCSGFYITPYFPMLEYDGQFYTTQASIIKKLGEIIGNVNKNNNVKKSRIEAYKALSYQILEPCLTLNFWGNEKNCQFLLKMYGSEKYFPMRLIYLRRMNSYIQGKVSHVHGIMNNIKDSEVNEMLESYFTDISHLLTLHKYLLGNTPGVLDAYVCGYLVPMYILNLPDKTLKSIIKRNDIIVKYILNYLKYYNIKVIQEISSNGVQDQDENDRVSLGLLATAGFVAMSLMVGYGIINDIFKLK